MEIIVTYIYSSLSHLLYYSIFSSWVQQLLFHFVADHLLNVQYYYSTRTTLW